MRKANFVWLAGLAILTILALACNFGQPGSSPGQDSPPEAGGSPLPQNGSAEQPQPPEPGVLRTTQTVSAILGGELRLDSPHGQVTLTIPSLALPADAAITLTILDAPPDNPFARSLFPGLRLEPDGLRLRLPASLTVALSGGPPEPGARLFYIKEPGLAYPIWQSSLSGSTLSGRITHFSQYTGSQPSNSEAQSQADAAQGMGGTEGSQANGEWGDTLNDMGIPEDAQASLDQAKADLEAEIACLSDPNCYLPPIDPCGEHLQKLMEIYKQATLLGFDPQGEQLSGVYTLLEKALNACTNSYTLEYSHKLYVKQDGLNQEFTVSGQVPFSAKIYGVFDTGQPLQLEGSGKVNVSTSGTITVEGKICTISGGGTNEVNISGQLEADETGIPWMAVQVKENWYTSGEMTFTCPEDDYSKTVPLTGMPGQEFPLRFEYTDGAKSMAPNLGGMQGEYIWIVHILHTW